MSALVLDSEGLNALARSNRGSSYDQAQAYLAVALEADAPVFVPAAVLAEQYRGGHFDQPIDSFLARNRKAISVVGTDRALARSVGNLLARHTLGTAHHVDATVVAVAARAGGAVILTADPDGIGQLADGLPNITVVPL